MVSEEDVKSGKVSVIAPKGFLEEAISENMLAGNAMFRRKSYTYGDALPASPFGHVDNSIGKFTAKGNTGIIRPNRSIAQPYEELTVDGVRMVFQSTPGTEAPVEMNTWFPDYKAFWAAENMVASLHNLYTLRGAKTRDAKAWAYFANQALYRFGPEAEVMFSAHTWPRWGNARVREVMGNQRDMYANLNNQVLHYANQGVTINQIHNVYAPPKSLQEKWYTHGYHGSYEHNSRAVINLYLGYWDANPATLVPLSPESSAPLYVEMMGGSKKILARGKKLIQQGKYRHAMEILNKLVYAEPKNQAAKDLLADAFEQLGYQSESPSLRNSYLTAAKELREGIKHARAADCQFSGCRAQHINLAAARRAGHPGGQPQGRGPEIQVQSHSPGHQRKVRGRDEQCHPDAYRRVPGTGCRLDDYAQPLRFRGDHAQKSEADRPGCGREGKAGRQSAVLKQLAGACEMFDPMFEIMPGTKAATKARSRTRTSLLRTTRPWSEGRKSSFYGSSFSRSASGRTRPWTFFFNRPCRKQTKRTSADDSCNGETVPLHLRLLMQPYFERFN